MADLPFTAVVGVDNNDGAQRNASDSATVLVTKAEVYKSLVQIIIERLKESGLENKPKRYRERGEGN